MLSVTSSTTCRPAVHRPAVDVHGLAASLQNPSQLVCVVGLHAGRRARDGERLRRARRSARPLAREWTRGDLDVRHQFVLQAGYTANLFTVTMFGRLQSGLPYTPMVSGDVNGDGFANDRAFIYDPSRSSELARERHELSVAWVGRVRASVSHASLVAPRAATVVRGHGPRR